ncbi:outer membrane protein assembly factor BamB family protein [Thermaurantiacus sp.]
MRLVRGAPFILLLVAALGLAACNRGEGRKGLFRRAPPAQQTIGERISVLDFEQSIEAAAELADLDVTLPAAIVNPGWSQPDGTASHALGHVALGSPIARLWRVRIGEGSSPTRRLNAPPIIVDNRLFVMDSTGRVTALAADTGRELWSRSLAERREGAHTAFGGGVSHYEGRLYATTGHGRVTALDPGTGAEIWQVEIGTPLRAAPTVAEGRVMVMSYDNRLTALNAATGDQLWQVTATLEPAGILGPGAPADEQGTVVAGFSSGELFALRIENGRTVWQDQLARTGRTTALGALSAIVASPVIDRGRVFAIGHGGRIVAIELATGQRVWERSLTGVSTPVAAGEFLFVVTTDSELVALTRGEGKIRWVEKLPRWKSARKKKGAIQWFGPLLAGGRLILVGSHGRMIEVDPATGRILVEHRLGAPARLPPVVANMMLYVLTEDGRVEAWR